MAQEKGKVKFIRKNGKIIPIREKGGSGKAPDYKAARKAANKMYDSGQREAKYSKERADFAKGFTTTGILTGVVAGAMSGRKRGLIDALGRGVFGGAFGGVAGTAIGVNVGKGGKLSKKIREEEKNRKKYSNKVKKSLGYGGDRAVNFVGQVYGERIYQDYGRKNKTNTGF